MNHCKICGNELAKSELIKRVCYPCENKMPAAEREKLNNAAAVRNAELSITQRGGSNHRDREILQPRLATANSMMITTETHVADIEIISRIGIVTAECVFGMNIFRDLFAGVRDLVGGRSGATQNILRDARTTVLQELRNEVAYAGGNAAIGVSLNYSEISGKNMSMLLVVATGTAIIVAP